MLPLTRRLALLGLVLASALLFPACDTAQGPPRRAVITSVQIDDAPLRTDTGGTWDDGTFGGGPEVYFRLFYADEDFLADPGRDLLNPRDDARVQNATTPGQPWVDDVGDRSFPLIWDIDGGFEIRDFNESYRIVLYDYDPGNSDDPMISTRPFTLAEAAPDQTDGRTDTIVLEGEGTARDRVLVRIRIRYER